MVAGMTRKYSITIAKDQDPDTQFRITLSPYRYGKAPRTKRAMTFVSQRSFSTERDAVRDARRLFGMVMIFKKDRQDRLRASFTLNTADA